MKIVGWSLLLLGAFLLGNVWMDVRHKPPIQDEAVRQEWTIDNRRQELAKARKTLADDEAAQEAAARRHRRFDDNKIATDLRRIEADEMLYQEALDEKAAHPAKAWQSNRNQAIAGGLCLVAGYGVLMGRRRLRPEMYMAA